MKKVIDDRTLMFYPSVGLDKATWHWKNGISTEGLLISYDVLLKISASNSASGNKDIRTILGFDGLVIVDSGAFGKSTEKDPVVVYDRQKKLKPDIAILLDEIPSRRYSEDAERQAINTTVLNARRIKKLNDGKLMLMAVAQGNSEKLLKSCSTRLDALGFRIVGIPLSHYSKYRQYEQAISKVKSLQGYFHKDTTFHGLGCGSRTMIAVLAYFGVRFFDSSAYYKTALHGNAVRPISLCSINKPGSKPECKECLFKQRKPASFKSIANYNLRETLKEIQRSRCALAEGNMKEYINARVEKASLKKIAHLI
jgi:queuine/archaeosine tRNA-ribosyltransferase